MTRLIHAITFRTGAKIIFYNSVQFYCWLRHSAVQWLFTKGTGEVRHWAADPERIRYSCFQP